MLHQDEIFEAAAALPKAARSPFLDEACAGDPGLHTRLESLLRSHDVAGFMEENPVAAARPDLRSQWDPPASELGGTMIGRYRLLDRIGEGGFGVVWMAEQVEPVTRRVALKIIKPGMDTCEVIVRFEAERQALAMMDHPNIAKVHDAGATAQGRPFFVMELVKGIPLTQFCDERELTNRQRLDLFLEVCAAVNHAHQKGVIHRDLKPSNVMVTHEADQPAVKVIDFGIAKAIEGRFTDSTLFTRFEHFIGTPAYMSPEQTALSGVDTDTRSDIYALGILLYELLTGKPPFDAKSLICSGYEEMRRIIREVEPVKPSTRLHSAAGLERTTLAQARHTTPEKLDRLIEPDLDWIVMKAIEKDRARRYRTVNGLARDIERFLSHEPVSASLRFDNKAVNLAIENIDKELSEHLKQAPDILESIVWTFHTLGLTHQIIPLAEKVRDFYVKKYGPQHEPSLVSSLNLAFYIIQDGRGDGGLEKATKILEELVTYEQIWPSGRIKEWLETLSNLSHCYEKLNRGAEAVRISEKKLRTYRGLYSNGSRMTLQAMSDLATDLFADGRMSEAISLREEVLACRGKVEGAEHPITLGTMHCLANMYHDSGRLEPSLKLWEEALPLFEKVFGSNHPDTLTAKHNLAESYFDAGRKPEAIKLLEEVVSLRPEVSGPTDHDTLEAMHDLATLYHDAGRPEVALKLREKVLPLRQKALGLDDPDTIESMTHLAISLRDAGRLPEGIALQEQALAFSRRILPPEHPFRQAAEMEMVSAYETAGRTDQARSLRKEITGSETGALPVPETSISRRALPLGNRAR